MKPRFLPVYRLLVAEWREWMDRTADVGYPADRIGAHLDGNAVVPQCAEAIGRVVLDMLSR